MSNFQVDKASEALKELRRWRDELKLDSDGLSPEKVHNFAMLSRVIPFFCGSHDKEGRPLYIEKTGKIQVQLLSERVQRSDFIKLHVIGMEKMTKLMQENSRKFGKPVHQLTTVLDLSGLGLAHRNVLHFLHLATELDQKYYPDIVAKVLVVNAPWVLPGLWEMIKMFVHESLQSRVYVLSNTRELLQHIDAAQLPEEYGGTLKVNLPELSEAEAQAELLKDRHGLQFEQVTVPAGSALELDLHGETGAEFQWSFEVSGGYDIALSVSIVPDSNPAAAPTPLAPATRSTAGKGGYRATEPCTLLFKWDNSYSYWNGKELRYHASVKHPPAAK